MNTKQLTDRWRAARWLPLVLLAACGSINEVDADGGATGVAGASGTAGAGGGAGSSGGGAGSSGGGAGSSGGGAGSLGGSGPGGAAGTFVNLGGSVGKDGGQTDGANPDVLDCMPGERRCEDDTPMTCDANRVWQAGTRCGNGCAAGTCARSISTERNGWSVAVRSGGIMFMRILSAPRESQLLFMPTSTW